MPLILDLILDRSFHVFKLAEIEVLPLLVTGPFQKISLAACIRCPLTPRVVPRMQQEGIFIVV